MSPAEDGDLEVSMVSLGPALPPFPEYLLWDRYCARCSHLVFRSRREMPYSHCTERRQAQLRFELCVRSPSRSPTQLPCFPVRRNLELFSLPP